MSTLLRLSGLEPKHFRLIRWEELQRDYERYSIPRMLLLAALRCAYRVAYLMYKIAAPEVLFRRVVTVLILQLTLEGIIPLFRRYVWRRFFVPQESERVKKLRKDIENAESYEEWRDLSRSLEAELRPYDKDDVMVTDRFQRMNEKTQLYNRLVSEKRVEELQYRLRGELLRKHWGLGSTDDAMTRDNPRGRRALHQYMDSVCAALALIANHTASEVARVDNGEGHEEEDLNARIATLRRRADFFAETHHSFGRSALCLSGGARLGLLHLGIVKALRDEGLLPRVISGSSAGSIVAVMLGAYRDDELDSRLFDPSDLNLKFFAVVGEDERRQQREDPARTQEEEQLRRSQSYLRSLMFLLPPPFATLADAASQVLPFWMKNGILLDVNVLTAAIRQATGDLTFQEAFERTGRIINVTVSSTANDRDFPMLLNYLTAPRVYLWSAAVASSSIPGVFAPTELMAKDMNGNPTSYLSEGLKWSDGSVESDLPMQRLSELFNVNHFIVSQVNPHARFLAPMSQGPKFGDKGPRANTIASQLAGAVESTTKVVIDFCRDETRSAVKHYAKAAMLLSPVFPLFAPVKIIGKALVPILTQKYSGDITIMPPLTTQGMMTLLTNPTSEEYIEDLRKGERIAWPYISRLRLHLAIELLLDDCRQSCRRQLARLENALLRENSGATATRKRGGSASSVISEAALARASILNLNELDVGVSRQHQLSQQAKGNEVAPTASLLQSPSSQSSPSNGTHAAGTASRKGSESESPRGSNNLNKSSNANGVGTRPARGSSLGLGRTPSSLTLLPSSGASSSVSAVPTAGNLGLRNSSFFNLSDKLKSRVQSFAADLQNLREEPEGEPGEGDEAPDDEGEEAAFQIGSPRVKTKKPNKTVKRKNSIEELKE